MGTEDTQPFINKQAALQKQRDFTPEAANLAAIQLGSAKELLARTKQVAATDENIIAVAELVARNAAELARPEPKKK